MPKLKTHKGAKKRFKVTATGKIMRRHAYRSHLLAKKSSKRKRRLEKEAIINSCDKSRIKQMLPY
ncbi:50S ribosomal protein L35 [SCandidatus Aminicenantes bacterium Aminicenantia_JdfR_composite]|jgi:large subunit ribosomal protein L35|nr:50S ribosomal protein L35 [SCandidatus Aminicenantes bacterium Aminicenantia_JdfR_composite]MCP2597056.1 50S ribosomal protein L35 [Candidatus Aminicenantes bacterium AC-335-G13]MCP2598588.1 50S ribosomal protein L35 [Candidatus Aminicenantes bacterium AC-335-L06]MCP2605463.1 50S ribosomal protein L35 [Candidatus Aminicenantes bacterium AC-335-O07]